MGETATERNLYKAFTGEAKASMRLKGYAEKADAEGFRQMARLFRAIAAAEEIHALKQLRLLKVIGSTEENLAASFEREKSVSENVYPEFIRTAEEEGNEAARVSFSHARDAEEYHAKLYKEAVDRMIADRDTVYHVCTICGFVAEGDAPAACPVCGVPASKFRLVS